MSCGPKMDKSVCPQCGGSKPKCGCGCGGDSGKNNCGCGGDKKKKCGPKMK